MATVSVRRAQQERGRRIAASPHRFSIADFGKRVLVDLLLWGGRRRLPESMKGPPHFRKQAFY